ncbi:hypothetical protein AB0N81_38920 [Streptomyces sp. NPDC093510]|uniref:hypothetical protein n=1 Tax=Streptomyces sp. NPDC093510 TaxID=3155199 RepID=UPI003444EFAB
MTVIVGLDEMIAEAEGVLLSPGGAQMRDIDHLAGRAGWLRLPDPEHTPDADRQELAVALTHLAKLLGALGMRRLSLSIVDMTLRHMDMGEADREIYTASDWNELGALLAEHGELNRSRLVLCRALSRAQLGSRVPERGRILANLSAVSLRMGDPSDADVWARKALLELDAYGRSDDPEARLTADWVRLEIARSGSVDQLAGAVSDFERSAKYSFTSKSGAPRDSGKSPGRSGAFEGCDHPGVIAAWRALATAKFELAVAMLGVEHSKLELCELEIVRLNASLLLGASHRETLVAQAELAVAEFKAAGGEPGGSSRRQRAVELLETAEGMAGQVLGREHPQARAIRETLAHLRVATVCTDDLPYAIDRVYTPQENDKRNKAKREAIEAEQSALWLVAHGGSSYLLGESDVFHAAVIRALERGASFRVIISSPWNTLSVLMRPPGKTADSAHISDLVGMIEHSAYYRESFLPVINAYLELKEIYGERVELRLTPMDISGSTLLTSRVGFFEPYMTTNPEGRTRQGLRGLEVAFLKDSAYYVDSLAEFRALWELSSTWKQFQAREEEAKRALLVAWQHWPTIG